MEKRLARSGKRSNHHVLHSKLGRKTHPSFGSKSAGLNSRQDWLTKQWTEGSARLGEDLSPIRGHGATLRASRAPFGPELVEALGMVGTPDIDVVAVQKQPEARGFPV